VFDAIATNARGLNTWIRLHLSAASGSRTYCWPRQSLRPWLAASPPVGV